MATFNRRSPPLLVKGPSTAALKCPAGFNLRCTVSKLRSQPACRLRGILGDSVRNVNTETFQVRAEHGIELPNLILRHSRSDLLAARVERRAFQADRKQSRSRLLTNTRRNGHLNRAGTNKCAMFTPLTDVGLKILVQVAGNRVAHRADDPASTVGDCVELVGLQETKPLHRHFDERVV